MANNFFRFKKFTIQQEKSAMKVTTDACVFGAWIAKNYLVEETKILDIGAGTGLLMLMLAQQTRSEIFGIEIDAEAAEEARENIEASEWKNRLTVFQSDVKQQHFENSFDLIISNPPFHRNQLQGPQGKKNLAHHSSALELPELSAIASANLHQNGRFAVLVPFYRTNEMIETTSKNQFFLKEKLLVKQSPSHDYFRSILVFSFNKNQQSKESLLTISDSNGNYTEEFKLLLKDYYLYL